METMEILTMPIMEEVLTQTVIPCLRYVFLSIQFKTKFYINIDGDGKKKRKG